MTDRARRRLQEANERQAAEARRRYVERERREHEFRRELNAKGHPDCTFFATEDGTIRCVHGELLRLPTLVCG